MSPKVLPLLALLSHPLLAIEVKKSRETAWSPEQTRQSIQLDGPYAVQKVAAEPLILDPVEVCWDAAGRCYVADMRDYPLGGPDGKPISRIQQLIDTNGDGEYDEAKTFADGLDHAQGLLPWKDGLIVTTRTEILYLKDTDGDGVADEKRPLIGGFNPSFSQLQVASPRWGLDGEVYFNNGLDTKEIYPEATQGDKLNAARCNLKWDPATGKLTLAAGFGQFGASFDDWGRHYSASNRSPVMLAVLPQSFATAHPQAGLTQSWENIAPFGPDSRVYPLQITHTTSDAHSGTHTSACGVGVYRGDLMPELKGEIFVPDPTGQLVVRYAKPQPKGASLSTDRVGKATEFLRSRDEWCRPVNVTTGPDGALYVCDIYRQYIDHARFFPEEFAKTHDLRSGEHQGRIWRIVPKDQTLRRIQPMPQDAAALVKLLDHPNAWQRETAQRLLLERRDDFPRVKDALQALTHEAQPATPEGLLHRLWTTVCLWYALPADQRPPVNAWATLLTQIESQPTAELRENLVLITVKYSDLLQEKSFSQSLQKFCFTEGHARARMLYLAATDPSQADVEKEQEVIMARLADLDDPWMQAVALSRYQEQAGRLAASLINSTYTREASPARGDFLRRLSASAASGTTTELQALLKTLTHDPGTLLWWKPSLIQGIAEGLPKRKDTTLPKSLAAFLKAPTADFQPASIELQALLNQVDQVLLSQSATLEQRLGCLPLLSQRGWDAALPIYKTLLSNQQPPALIQGAFTTLKRFGADRTAPLLYEVLPTAAPTLRQEIVTFLAANQKTAIDLFQRMEREEVSKSLVDAETRWRFLQSKDPAVLALAEKLFQRPSEDRAAVLTKYLAATKMQGDAKRGELVFQSVCIGCHSYRGQGIAVGPDISDVRAREKDALLNDILDPNRMIEARWSAYQVETHEGRTLVGLMEGDTADGVVMKLPGGLRETIARTTIKSQKSLDASLMPVGLEAAISLEQMADLLTFLRGES